MVMCYSYFSRYTGLVGLGVRTYIQTDVCTDSQVTIKIFKIDGLSNFRRYGALLMYLWHVGAPLISIDSMKSWYSGMSPKISCTILKLILLMFKEKHWPFA